MPIDLRVPTLHDRDQPVEDQPPVALLVDDSPDVHKLLSLRLQSDGLNVIGATSGAEGVKLALERQPSVVLLDIDMPGMDGFEVLRALKESDVTLHIPVIMLSGLHNSHDKVTAFDLGAVDFIPKPFDVTELRVRVRWALRLNQLLLMLSKLAHVDGLTGLYNRAHFDRRWSEAVSTARRHGRPLSLAMLDLDHFKSINDTYGHPAGDAALQGFAKLLRRECRESDVACRYGGEEFALIMPETTPLEAEALAERVCKDLAGLTWPKHPERAVTASVGIVGSDGSGTVESGEWLEMADQNLYRAKKAGRNRVVVSSLDGSLRMVG